MAWHGHVRPTPRRARVRRSAAQQHGLAGRLFAAHLAGAGDGVISAVAVLASVALTAAASIPLLASARSMFWINVGISISIPLLVAPPIAFTIVRLMHELAEARRTVEQLAITDALTGACTRRHLNDIGMREVARAQRTALPLSLLVIDLDNFKRINDTHGHLAGDRVLRSVGQTCLAAVRPYDLVARYGGEEIVVLLPSTALDEARALAERLRDEIAGLNVFGGADRSIQATASIGVAALDPSIATLDALFARADAAMYAAKRSGKNRVVVA